MKNYYEALSEIDYLFINNIPHEKFVELYPKLYRHKGTLMELVDRATLMVPVYGEVHERTAMVCPVCHAPMLIRIANYCHQCGQALDWSVND